MSEDEREFAFDGGSSPRTRKQICYQLNDRLKMQPGVNYTRFSPSRITPDTVVASVDPTMFLSTTYPGPIATLEIWWSPRSSGKDHFTIQWYEAPDSEETLDPNEATDPTLPEGYTISCGWHQDEHFNELGEAHFQEDYPDGSVERYGVTFGDVTPRWILSECLRELPARLERFRDRLDGYG